jgi:hypothetical protein
MALVDHRHGGATLGAVGTAAKVQHDVLKKRFKNLISNLRTEGKRKMVVMGNAAFQPRKACMSSSGSFARNP